MDDLDDLDDGRGAPVARRAERAGTDGGRLFSPVRAGALRAQGDGNAPTVILIILIILVIILLAFQAAVKMSQGGPCFSRPVPMPPF